MKRCAALLLVLLALAACGQVGAGPTAATSPTAHPTPALSASPAQQLSASFGALVDLGTGPNAAYRLVMVRSDGKVVADLHPATRTLIMASGISAPAAIELPYVSTSDDKLYFLDGDSTVKSVDANGTVAVATHVAGSAHVHAAFAVSPDDRQIAVSLIDYSTPEPQVHLLISPLENGGTGREIYSSSSNYVWPVAWHQASLVLAAGPIYSQQGVAWNPYDAASYHVVDPASANRIATVGSGEVNGGCQPVGPLSMAGTACFVVTNNQGSAGQTVATLDWSGRRTGSVSASGQTMGALSADGRLAYCCDQPNRVLIRETSGATDSTPLTSSPDDWVCWLDATHLLSGFVLAQQGLKPAVLDVSGKQVTAIDASGFCAATLPGLR